MDKVDTSPANDIVVRVRNLRLGTVDGAEILHSVDSVSYTHLTLPTSDLG